MNEYLITWINLFIFMGLVLVVTFSWHDSASSKMGLLLLLHGRNEFERLFGMQIFEIGCLAMVSNSVINPKFLSSTPPNLKGKKKNHN